MVGTPPGPEEIARWLVAFESGKDHGSMGSMVVLEHIYTQLRAGLTVFFGTTGFESLWGRAMFRAHITFPLNHDNQEVVHPITEATHAADDRIEDPEGDIPLLALTSFIGLLFSFVGVDLGSRLIYHMWPELPLGNQDLPTGAPTL